MSNEVPSAQRHFLVKVEGVDGYFQTKSGGNISADTTKNFDGGAEQPDVMASPPQAEDVTVGRAFKRQRDGDFLAAIRLRVGKERRTVSVQPTDGDMVASGKAVDYPQALLVGLNEMEVDSSSGEPSMYEMVWSIGSWR